MSAISDEMLMRFADGELDAAATAAIEQAMESDDALVARAAMFIETRAAAQAALRPLLDEPVPDKLKAAVEDMIAAKRAEDRRANERTDERAATVLPFQPRTTAVARPASRRWTLPLAASLAAAIGGLAGYQAAGNDTTPDAGLAVAGVVGPVLGDALETVRAGAETRLANGDRFRAIATFRDNTQELCREFEVDSTARSTVIAVACSAGGAWRVSFAVAAPGDAQGYAPASSTEALDAYLAAIEAGQPLVAEDEAQALAAIERR